MSLDLLHNTDLCQIRFVMISFHSRSSLAANAEFLQNVLLTFKDLKPRMLTILLISDRVPFCQEE